MAEARPSGTATFFFTDIEGSTRLWEERPDEMQDTLATHDEIVRSAIAARDGYVFATGGDSFAAAFADAVAAVEAATVVQDELAGVAWPEGASLRVRIGLHTGTADERDGDYFGPTGSHPMPALAVELAEDVGDPAVLARALTVDSWSVGLRDVDAALEMLDRAGRVALEAGLGEIAGDAGAYRPVPLALAGRTSEALAVLDEQLAAGCAEDHLAHSTLLMLGHSVAVLNRPELAADLSAGVVKIVEEREWPVAWNNYVFLAFAAVAEGELRAAAPHLDTAQQRARLTGTDDGLPDLLVPIALVAFYRDDHERCARLLAAVRAAGRRTQSFAPTIVYRRLRREMSLPAPDIDLSDTTAIYVQARDWLDSAPAPSAMSDSTAIELERRLFAELTPPPRRPAISDQGPWSDASGGSRLDACDLR